MAVSFKVSRRDAELIRKIASRAKAIAVERGLSVEQIDVEMDVCACHANGCKLNLARLLTADRFSFLHDVFGIRNHLDRKTGQLRNCFVPRCAV